MTDTSKDKRDEAEAQLRTSRFVDDAAKDSSASSTSKKRRRPRKAADGKENKDPNTVSSTGDAISEETKKKKKRADASSKFWVFTTNNPTDEDVPKQEGVVQSCIWQRERGADGTEHFQVIDFFRLFYYVAQ